MVRGSRISKKILLAIVEDGFLEGLPVRLTWMDWPRCRICETRHNPRFTCPHEALARIGQPSELLRAKAAPQAETIAAKKKRGKFDRKAYQRAYMRRRRARLAAKDGVK